MNDFVKKLKSIRSAFFRRKRSLLLLDFISIFSIIYAISIILNAEFFLARSGLRFPFSVKFMPLVIASVMAALIALFLHRKDKKTNVVLLIEKKYPDLNEKLRTAWDNREETNVIVESLKSMVLGSLKAVSASGLVSAGAVASKIAVAAILISASAVVSLNPEKYAIPTDTLINAAGTVTGAIDDITNETLVLIGVPADSPLSGKADGGEIFGRPTIAPIEGKPVDLSLEMGLGEGNLPRDYSEAQTRFIRSAEFPVDVLGSNVSDGGYSILLKKTETEKKLIEDYAVERSKI